jgi:hypothetical protein
MTAAASPSRPVTRGLFGFPTSIWLLALLAVAGMLVMAFRANLGATLWSGDRYALYWVDDQREFTQLALSVLHGHGWQAYGRPSAWREPLPPLYQALWYGLLGERYTSLLVGHGLLLLVSVLLTYRAGTTVGGHRTGLWAAGLTVANLYLLKLASLPDSELLAYTCVVMAAAAGLKFIDDGRHATLLQAGIALGLATLTRSTTIALLPVLLGLAWWRRRDVRSLAMILLPLCVVSTAWGLRNVASVGRFIPFSNRLGLVMLLDNNMTALQEPFAAPYDCRYLAPADRRDLFAEAPPITDPTHEAWISARSWPLVRGAIGTRPDLYLRRCLRRVIAFYSPYLTKTTRQAQIGQALKWLIVLVPGAWALWRWRREPWAWLCCGYILVSTVELNLLIGLATQRYRVLVEPAFTLAAARLYARTSEPAGNEP